MQTHWKDIEFSSMRHARETAAALLDERAELMDALHSIVNLLEAMRDAAKRNETWRWSVGNEARLEQATAALAKAHGRPDG